MSFERALITGGAAFVGSSLAISWKREGVGEVLVVDSLKRRGSELNLARLQAAGIPFLHADVRCPEDLDGLPKYDLLIDCSAEPSVHSGMSGTSRYLLNTNLIGTMNCLEAASARQAAFLFLSTSRVYPIVAINSIAYREEPSRFSWNVAEGAPPGVSTRGINEDFTLAGARSLYGT